MKSCEIGTGEKPNEDQIERLKKITSEIPDDDILIQNADTIKALADPTRLKILYLLKYGELCVCEIFTAMEKPQPTISHHLNILKKAGFLKWRKEGVWVHYSLSNLKITDFLENILENK
jgi:DNA-binding transcriptional ArsR family regulator